MGAVRGASVICTATCTTRGEGNGRSRPPARRRPGCREQHALPRLLRRLILHVRLFPRIPLRTQRTVVVGVSLTGRHLAAREKIVAELRGRGRITPVGAKRARR